MYSQQSSCVHSVNHQAISICAQRASKDKHRFIVGTYCLHEENEVSVLEYDEDSGQMHSTATYAHCDQICAIASSPTDESTMITSSLTSTNVNNVTLWKMPGQCEDNDEDFGNNDRRNLETIATFDTSNNHSKIQSIGWHHLKDNILLSSSNTLTNWTISNSDVQKCGELEYSKHTSAALPQWTSGVAAWDPHSSGSAACVFGTTLALVDTRKMSVTAAAHTAHKDTIRDVDYNPNKPMMLVTAGNDQRVCLWDSRNLSTAVKTLVGHSHWVSCARYNPFHDQLLISGSSDSVVNLWRIASCSSSPWISGEGEDAAETEADSSEPPDIRVRAMDQHEESVCGLAWSPADAWIYASLSYDGRVIISHVPSSEKYKILL